MPRDLERNDEPPFTLGIEEEYLVVDAETLSLTAMPEGMFADAQRRLGDNVEREFRDCMIEIGTKPCRTLAEARVDLARCRRAVHEAARAHGVAIIAASCHPIDAPEDRGRPDSERYEQIARSVGGIADRQMTCGMHVHVGLGGDDDLRVDLMNQSRVLLPFVLGLSASSPFWKGEDTRLSSYRLNVFDAMPRSGLPPSFRSWNDYAETVGTFVENGIVEDASKIWWDVRPSTRYPTLEVRIADVMPRMDDALAVVALIQSTMRHLWALRQRGLEWRVPGRAVLEENRWAAQRHGVAAQLIDMGSCRLRTFENSLEELIDVMSADARAAECEDDLRRCLAIARDGSSAGRQRTIYQAAIDEGLEPRDALRRVLRKLADEFHEGIDAAAKVPA